MKNNSLIHFDVDEHIQKYLPKNSVPYSISNTALKKLKKENINYFSCKSQSNITDGILALLPNLKLIITRTAGTNHIDLNRCKKKNIAVYNIVDYGAFNIAEHALALLMSGARNIVSANDSARKGKFSYKSFLGTAIKGKTTGVIGTGRIGLEFIRLMKSMGTTVYAYDVYKNEKTQKELDFSYVTLLNLLKKSDFISIHVPLLPETKHLLSDKEFSIIKPGTILVNTARGEIIDTKALIKYSHKFKAICLDVLEEEGSFSKKNPLLKLKNVIMTPHIAFFSDESIKTIATETIKNIERFEKGENTNRVI